MLAYNAVMIPLTLLFFFSLTHSVLSTLLGILGMSGPLAIANVFIFFTLAEGDI